MTVAGRCALCGEWLDIGATRCRLCGEGQLPPEPESEAILIPNELALDQLGGWSQVKHKIVSSYARTYMTIMARQDFVRRVVYIDAFAGAGVAEDRETGEILYGSALQAADVTPQFDELHFIEREPAKAALLRRLMEDDSRARIYDGDAEARIREILPRCQWNDYARALCLLDPYGLSVSWDLLAEMGGMRSVEIFFNFMVMGANRNVLWTDPTRVPQERLALMDRMWPSREAWMSAAYVSTPSLFGDELRKGTNEQLVEGFRRCLKNEAGFPFVPEPIAMRNRTNAPVYYLFFATHNRTGHDIVTDIFNKYRET